MNNASKQKIADMPIMPFAGRCPNCIRITAMVRLPGLEYYLDGDFDGSLETHTGGMCMTCGWMGPVAVSPSEAERLNRHDPPIFRIPKAPAADDADSDFQAYCPSCEDVQIFNACADFPVVTLGAPNSLVAGICAECDWLGPVNTPKKAATGFIGLVS